MSSVTLFHRLGRASLILAALMLAMPAAAQRGALTVPRNLEQLTDRAADIVRGTVAERACREAPRARQPRHARRHAAGQRYASREPHSGTFTFRQYIWDVRDRQDAAGYRKGQEYVLLLNASSRYGLTSPAGLEQGRFRVLRDARGPAKWPSTAGATTSLFAVSAATRPKGAVTLSRVVEPRREAPGGPIAVDDLVRLIRELVGKQG